CITHGTTPQDNVLLSQHFFSLKLTKEDVLKVLKALRDASVVTEHNASANNHQLVNNGGPADVTQLVQQLGTLSNVTSFTRDTLSTRVQLRCCRDLCWNWVTRSPAFREYRVRPRGQLADRWMFWQASANRQPFAC